MKLRKSIAIIMLYITSLLSCSESTNLTKDEMMSIVHEGNAKLEKAFLSEDIDRLIEVYAPDARLCPDGDTFYPGKDAIRNFWKSDFETSTLVSMHTNTLSVSGNRDVVYETGVTETEFMRSDSSTAKGSVKYINVWTRQADGTYKLSIDFWNRNKQ